MPTLNFQAINRTRELAARSSDAARISEVSRLAGELQSQAQGLTRTDALKRAESVVPHRRPGVCA